MSPPSDNAVRIYAQFMEEIKERLDAAAKTVTALRENTFPHTHYTGAEFCLLQLRMTYELIALACAIMHARAGAHREVWKADVLIKQLANWHADFYPVPVHERLDGDTLHVWPASEPYLTKELLIDHYGRLGDKLHRGRGGDILLNRPRVYDLDNIVEQLNLVSQLLHFHYIKVASEGHFVRVAMSDPNTGEVTVNAWTPTG